ncbi:hypothetical protein YASMINEVIRUS_211 [Yasminevirus sp. GU-2018]|uniref:CDP-alcohol phosphatidyltransferase n=1 Tax=Yasminevirus sp. GU-2018 TaxID=2420051 RepID=A0A5K0U762_9VIRU|nr:hypothetical protein YASMINEVIRUS_211 [Yasminevirus sp. GU-2018]
MSDRLFKVDEDETVQSSSGSASSSLSTSVSTSASTKDQQKSTATYSYHTSDKSILDTVHDSTWMYIANLFATYLPWVTPNMVTLIGFTPLFMLFMTYLCGYISDASMYFWLAPLIVLYINMDAVDGKLARLTNRSSPFGQMVDHGCDAVMAGVMTFLLAATLTSMYDSYFTRFTVALSVLAIYTGQMFCNLTEFYTGGMIVSIGKISTTELGYACAVTAFIDYLIFASGFTTFGSVVHMLCRLATIGLSSYGVHSLYTTLTTIPAGTKKKGTDALVKPFAFDDITHYIFTNIAVVLIMFMTHFSVYEIVMSLLYISGSMIDIIFSNATKRDSVLFDNITLTVTCLKTFTVIFIGSGFLSMLFDMIVLVQFFSDKISKRDYILARQEKLKAKKAE